MPKVKSEPAQKASENKPTAQAKKKKKKKDKLDADGRVFGYRNSLVHAALGLNGEWTNNLYNHHSNKVDNFLTHVTPSVWFTWPRRARRPLQLVLDNTATGGMQYSQTEYDVFNKYQVYLGGNLDFMRYSANSDLDHTEGSFEGLVQYQPGSRLTLRLLDKYALSQDIFNVTEATAENNRVYDSNVFGLGAVWGFADRFSAKIGYKNFLLMYQDPINSFLDRADNGFEGALSYEYSPKTNFFLEYQYLLAEYDEEQLFDNDNSYLNLGVNWQATVKTSLMAKTGYQQVDYDYKEQLLAPTTGQLLDESTGAWNFEVQGIWQATRKMNLLLNTKYNIEQTDSLQALNKAVWAARLGLDYRFTNRLRGDVNLIYENSDYEQFQGEDRLDDRWYLKPELQYAVTKWLALNLYCSFDEKDSNFDELDYATSTLGIGARGTL